MAELALQGAKLRVGGLLLAACIVGTGACSSDGSTDKEAGNGTASGGSDGSNDGGMDGIGNAGTSNSSIANGGDGGGANASGTGDPTETPIDDDAKVDIGELGDPLTGDDDVWTHVPTEGSKCRDGSSPGFGINLHSASDKLLIFMEGGGACFNTITCIGNPQSWGGVGGISNPMLERSGDNPFKDYNMVYIPYCSGDVHTGTNESGYNGQPMTGYTNYILALRRIVPTFKDKVDMIVHSGSSAGGFGTAWNWMTTQDAFGEIPVHALDDAGPPMGPEYLTPCLQQYAGEMWGWNGSIHPSCIACDLEAGNVVRPLMDTTLQRQKTRYALPTTNEDSVIKTFFGYGLEECAQINPILLGPAYPAGMYPKGLAELREHVKPFTNAAMFEIDGSGHPVMSGNPWGQVVGGISLLDWVIAFRDGTGEFINRSP